MDIERLRTDPAYWDEVAPEGAEYAAENTVLGGVHWYRRIRQGSCGVYEYEYCLNGEAAWREGDGEPLFPRFPRPSQPQWRGPEDGLPPVGTVCEAKYAEDWHRCTIVAHLRDHMGMTDAVFQAEDDWDFHQRPEMFRPLKSDKERAIDAAVAATILKDGPRIRAALSDIYDSGLLRLPEDSD